MSTRGSTCCEPDPSAHHQPANRLELAVATVSGFVASGRPFSMGSRRRGLWSRAC
jgi:hypothetical protein